MISTMNKILVINKLQIQVIDYNNEVILYKNTTI